MRNEEPSLESSTVCQSCGMPMERDEAGGGTEADGSVNTKFCSHCYHDGAFTLPDLTVEEMQSRVEAKLRQFEVPEGVRERQVASIWHLRRWQNLRTRS